MTRRFHHARVAPVALAAVLLVGCAAPTVRPLAAARPRAAEPAVSPPLTTQPAGTVVDAGPSAQGVAVDPSTGVVAVGEAGGVDLFDESGRRLATVRLPSGPRHVGLLGPGGPFLVPAEGSARLELVAEPAGTVTASVPTGTMPHEVVVAGGRVFVGDEHDNTVTVVRADRAVATFPVAKQPGGLATVGPDVAVVAVRARRVQLFDATTLRKVADVPIQGGPSHVASFGGRLYVVDTGGTRVQVFATVPHLRQIGSVTVPASPLGEAVDTVRARLWVTCTAANRLVELSLSGRSPRVVATYPTVRQPDTVAVDPTSGTVFVVGVDPGSIEILHPGRG